MSLILEVSEAMKNSREFYLEDIYNSAKMSVVRNLVENFQSKMLEKINDDLHPDNLPVEGEIIQDIRAKSVQDSRKPFDETCFSQISFHSGLPFYYEVINNVIDLIEKKRKENDKISDEMGLNLVSSMLERLTDVDEIPEESLQTPNLFSDLEAMFKEYLNLYFSNIQGTVKCK